MKHIRSLSLALLGIILAFTSAVAQETGACPAGQFVNSVGNNIVSTACAPLGASAGLTGQLLQAVTGGNSTYSTSLSGAYIFTNPLITFGAVAGTPTHLATAQTTAPVPTSCGTGSPTVVGTDTAGTITMGTSATGCVVTFNVAYVGTPVCVVNWIATPLASQSYVTSNTALTLTQTSASGNVAKYICMAPSGG